MPNRSALFLALSLPLLALAELQMALQNIMLGLALHTVLLLLLMVLAASEERISARLATVLILLPLLRILGYAVPLPRGNIAFTYLLITLALFVAIILSVWRLRLTPAQLGLRLKTNWMVQGALALSGAGIGFGAARLLHVALPLTGLESGSLVVALVVLTASALVEGVLYRGLIQTVAVEALGGFGLFTSVFIYLVMALCTPTLPLFLLNVAVAAWWTLCMWRTRTLWGALVGQAAFVAVFFVLAKG